jgi:hypothetical protein
MPVTQSDIDNLNAAIASGERQVTIGGQTVTYRSIGDLIQARNDLRNELEAQDVAAGTKSPRARQTRLYYAGRGYGK